MNIDKEAMMKEVQKNEHYSQALDMQECGALPDLESMLARIILLQQDDINELIASLKAIVDYGKGRRAAYAPYPGVNRRGTYRREGDKS